MSTDMSQPIAGSRRAQEYPEGSPLADPENRRKFDAAKEVFYHLAKGIKQIALYRHSVAKYPEFLERAHQSLGGFLETYGLLSVKVETQSFNMFKEPLTDDADLAFRFHRDGIRHLIFRPGLELQELVDFTLIATTNYDAPEHRGEDVIQNLWKANFGHIEYVVVEGFKIAEMSEEQVEIEVDKIVNYLYGRLRSNSEDYLRFARVSADDLEMKLAGVDQVRGAVIAGETATDKLKEAVKEELRVDEEERLLGKLVIAIFQVLEDGGVEDRASIEEIFVQMLDALLLQEDFQAINSILVKFRSFERDVRRAEQFRGLRQFFLAKMGEQERIGRIGEILNNSRPKNLQEAFRYLVALDQHAIVPLLEALDKIEIAEHRVIVCDALAAIGKETPDPFIARLQSDKSQLVRDMLYIIDKLDLPNKMEVYGQVLKHPSLPVKLEALGVISRSKSEQCRRFIVDALADPVMQMRLQAARVLPNYGADKALVDLMRVVKAPEFEKKAFEEKAGFHQALGSTMLPGALAFFQQELATKSLFAKAKVREAKLLAIAGLGACPSIAAYKILQGEVENKGNELEVLTAARKAMHGVKKQLFGDAPEGG